MPKRIRHAGGAVSALLLILLVGGCAGAATTQVADVGAPADPIESESVAPEQTEPPAPLAEGFGRRPTPTATPTATPTVTPTATATRTPAPARPPSKAPPPRKSPKPPTEALPPPPPPPPPTNCKPSYVGSQASRGQAKQALTDAAGRVYWPNSAPSIRVPVDLVKAVAWQESGWQSNIIACDGGIGLMQVMPDTVQFVNNRFDQSYDVDDYRDNATIGANYLAWLTKYIGDALFESNYSLDAENCSAGLDSCLLNAVIAAYNFGPGAVVTSQGLIIPNPSYVRNVRALMTECECLAF